MKIQGKYKIESIFELTGRGIVLAGRLLNGNIEKGNLINVIFQDHSYSFRIRGVEMVNAKNYELINLGLLVNIEDSELKSRLKSSEGIDIPASIVLEEAS